METNPAAAAARESEAQRRAPAQTRPSRSQRHHLRPADRHPVGVPARRAWRRLRDDLLAQTSRLAGGWRVAEAPHGASGRARRRRKDRLAAGCDRYPGRGGKKGGEQTGPNPTDRGKTGTKRHLMVDATGIPLALKL